MKASRGGPEISYLFFADDQIIFSEAKEEQMLCIKEKLKLFCRSSGQMVNYSESSMLCSNNIPSAEVERFSTCLGVPLTKKLGKYLGHHVLSSGRNGVAHKDLVERVCSRLDGWQARCLSMVGRITLANLVLTSILSSTCKWRGCHVRFIRH